MRGTEAGFLGNLYDTYRVNYAMDYSGRLKESVDALTDRSKYSLLPLGNVGAATGWQRDWTEARNVAFHLALPAARGRHTT